PSISPPPHSYRYPDPPLPHAFPTRRSSDLPEDAEARGAHDPGSVLQLHRHLLDEGEHHPDDVGKRRREVHEEQAGVGVEQPEGQDRKSTRLNSSHVAISYAVCCLKEKN